MLPFTQEQFLAVLEAVRTTSGVLASAQTTRMLNYLRFSGG